MKLIIAFGLLMAPVSICGLLFHQSYLVIVCPQAQIVMFMKAILEGAMDFAPGPAWPDITVAALYWPLVAAAMVVAQRADSLARCVSRIAYAHLAAVLGALLALAFEHRISG
jgi:hypothetical protein